MSRHYVPTKYLSYSTSETGSLVIYNTLNGAICAVPPGQAAYVKGALKRSARHRAPLEGILQDLSEGGFLIPEGTDENELRHLQYLRKYDDHSLRLIVMPTEACNFRCTYCYESFERGKMPPELREGIKRFVATQSRLEQFDLSWFGGEPLLAADVVVELTQHFHIYCQSHGIRFSSSLTTNGSLLTPDLAEQLLPYGLSFLQITLDGVEEEHDKRRVPIDGAPSFRRIMDNLRYLKSTSYPFVVSLRHNFDPEGLRRLEEFLQLLAQEFGGDPRFTTSFYAIGTWGGANDDRLEVCEQDSAYQAVMRARRLATEAGLRNTFVLESLQPNGVVCYAANPRSFVIGSDGQVYKCTVELDYHDRNIVGRLHPDGSMDLDWRKVALWCETNGLEEGKKCSTCFFSPSCYGAARPKDWMDSGDCHCPTEKVTIRETLQLIQLEATMPEADGVSAGLQCTRG